MQRILKFLVEGQVLSLDPSCDFSGLTPGTKDYLQAEFRFSPEWAGSARVASFFSNLGNEFPPQELKDGKTCFIPAEALAKSIFKVQVIGRKGSQELRTTKVTVHQKGAKL